ncbi:MAG: hypothetical protein ACREQ7_18330 [Candidatus Binatia bacterium]
MKLRILLGLLAAWAGPVVTTSLAVACSVCVTGSANDPSAGAYNWSVLFLMAAPYLVAGSVAGWLVYSYRRAAAKREEIDGAAGVDHLAWNQKESGR